MVMTSVAKKGALFAEGTRRRKVVQAFWNLGFT
jgi:hypothetical protein